MTRHDPRISFLQMRDHVQEAVSLSRKKSRADLEKDRILNLALTRLLEIVGEAAGRIPTDLRVKFAGLPWVQIIGMRNRLIHAYDQVDLDIRYEIVSEDLPALSLQLDKILQNWEK
ncbi:MAG TPA: HepT-like ribonuclease domain-containing protein [bacterium]|jgi:uncharacterized protein with HEPN domain|nr:HepT-like ribonuclease domain-containing protein [bacterium]